MINEKDNNEAYENKKVNNSLKHIENNQDRLNGTKINNEDCYENNINTDLHPNKNNTFIEVECENECFNNNQAIEKNESVPNNQIIEEKSSIFNSKNQMNKSVFEQFFEQNNFLYLSSLYDEQVPSSEDLHNIINYDEKIDLPVKPSSKISIPINRFSGEKQVKKKKNMNNLKRELDTPLTHSIFEKNDTIEEIPRKEEDSKYPYKPLDKEKEEKFEQYCEQISKQISNKTPTKKIVKINERETEAQNLHVNTLLNDYTKGFFYSNVHSDIIQSSLEYNNYLINQLISSKNKLPKSEYEHGLIILWENLKKLSKNAETHLKFFQLRNETKYNDLYSNFLRDVETLKNEKLDDSLASSDSFDNSEDKIRRKRKRLQEKKSSEFTIVIDKSILKDNV